MSINVNDVTNALNPVITTVKDTGEQSISLGSNDDTTYSVPVVSFVSLFSNAVDMTGTSLNAIDGGKMGYASYISEWQQKGYIK